MANLSLLGKFSLAWYRHHFLAVNNTFSRIVKNFSNHDKREIDVSTMLYL